MAAKVAAAKATVAAAKTVPTTSSVRRFLDGVSDPNRRADCDTLVTLMTKATGEEPRMWGSSIVGFGTYHYKYASGREGECALASFSPRKKELTIYLFDGVEAHADALAKLGSPACGKGCVYVKSLAGVDLGVLERMITASVKNLRRQDATRR
jgi:Domain of unknown function (DU1801)